jgi:hypothetical protein
MFSFLDQPKNNNYPELILPRSTLGYKTNNQYKDFPPKMADGRSIQSTWNSETQINDKLIKENNIMTNWEYRKYLTQNSKTIMQYNFVESCNDTGYIIPPKTIEKESKKEKLITPFTFDNLNDRSKPFENSDLKELYLTKEQLNARKMNPIFEKS